MKRIHLGFLYRQMKKQNLGFVWFINAVICDGFGITRKRYQKIAGVEEAWIVDGDFWTFEKQTHGSLVRWK